MSKVISGIASFFSSIFSIFKAFKGGNWVMGVLMLFSLFGAKKKAVAPTVVNDPVKDSPTYSWDGIQSSSDVDMPIPIVFGKHMIGGNIVNTYVKSNLRNTEIQTELNMSNFAYSGDDITYNVGVGASKKLYIVMPARSIYVGSSTNFRGMTSVSVSTYCPISYKLSTDTVWKTITDSTWTSVAAAGTYNIKIAKGKTYSITQTELKNYTMSIYNEPTGNISAQTLYLDVALSVGEITKINKLWVNNQRAESFNDYTNPVNSNDRRIRIKYTTDTLGYDAIPEANRNDTINKNSTVYSLNQVASCEAAVKVLQESYNDTDNKCLIVIGDNSKFTLNETVSWNTSGSLTGNTDSSTIIGLVDSDKIKIDRTDVVGSFHFTADFFIIKTDTSKYFKTRCIYETKNDYVDGLDIGINCPNGLYSMEATTGNLKALQLDYNVRIIHKADYDYYNTDYQDKSIDRVPTEKVIVNKQVSVSGSKRTRLWYNFTVNDGYYDNNVLPIFNETYLTDRKGEKAYIVEITKITPDASLTNQVNDLQIAYVEELKDIDVYYNKVAYSTVTLPADSRLNGGNPTLKFEIHGVKVPFMLHRSLKLDEALSPDLSNIIMSNNDVVNYNNKKINTIVLNEAYKGIYEFDKDLDTFSPHYIDLLTGKGAAQPIICFFKCGNEWIKRYCVYSNEIIGNNVDAELNQHGKFTIVTNTSSAYVNEINQPLPSFPTDVIYYAWSNNPALCVLYLLTNEDNGLGFDFSMIDIESFYEAALHYFEYVDDPTSSDPNIKIQRCSLDYVIDVQAEIRTHLEKILNTCHATIYEYDNKIKFMVEKVQAPTAHIDEDVDILEGSLSLTTIPSKDLPNQINVTFLNAENDYAKETFPVESPELANAQGYDKVRKMDIELFGIVHKAQCVREAMMLIKTGKYLNYIANFKLGTKCEALDVTNVFTFTSSTYGFVNKTFKILSSKKAEDGTGEFTAIEYFDEVYSLDAEDLIKLKDVKHTELPNVNQPPDSVKNLVLYEENELSETGDTLINLCGHFNTPSELNYVPTAPSMVIESELTGATIIKLKSVIDYKVNDFIMFGDENTAQEYLSNNIVFPYEISSVDKINNTITLKSAITSDIAENCPAYKADYDLQNKYEYSKYNHALVDVYEKQYIKSEFSYTEKSVIDYDSYLLAKNGNFIFSYKNGKIMKYDTVNLTYTEFFTVNHIPYKLKSLNDFLVVVYSNANYITLINVNDATKSVTISENELNGRFGRLDTVTSIELVTYRNLTTLFISSLNSGRILSYVLYLQASIPVAVYATYYSVMERVNSNFAFWKTTNYYPVAVKDFIVLNNYFIIMQIKNGRCNLVKYNMLGELCGYLISDIFYITETKISKLDKGFALVGSYNYNTLIFDESGVLLKNIALSLYDILLDAETINGYYSLSNHKIAKIEYSNTGIYEYVKIENNISVEDNYFKFTKLKKTEYKIEITSVSLTGLKGNKIVKTIPLSGTLLKPSDITNFTATQQLPVKYSYKFTWDAVLDKNLKYYILKIGDSNSDVNSAVEVYKGKELSYIHNFTSTGNFKAFIYAVNTSDLLSINIASIDITGINLNPAAPTAGILYQTSDGNINYKFTASINNNVSYKLKFGLATLSDSDPDVNFISVFNTSSDKGLIMKATSAMHGNNYKLYVQAIDISDSNKKSEWLASNSITVDVKPANPTIVSAIVKNNNSISLMLSPSVSNLSFKEFEIHVKATDSDYTPDANTLVAKARVTQYMINQMPNGNALFPATTYKIKVRALSSASSDSDYQSDFVAVDCATIDTIAPEISIIQTTPTLSDTGIMNIGTSNFYVKTKNSDNVAVNLVKGRIYEQGNSIGVAYVDFTKIDNVTYDYTFTNYAFASGKTYVIEVVAVDAYGTSGSSTKVFEVDSTQAEWSVTDTIAVSQENNYLNILITDDSQVSHFKNYTVEYATSVDNITWSSWSSFGEYIQKEFTATVPISGYVKCRAKINKIHDATLSSTYIESNVVYIDRIAPTLKITSTPDIFEKFTLLPSNTITFNFECVDEGGMDLSSGLKFYLDGIESAVALTLANDKYTGSLTYNNLTDTVHTISAKATDIHFNTRESQNSTFEVDASIPADITKANTAVNISGRTTNITITYTEPTNFSHYEFYKKVNTTETLIGTSKTKSFTYIFESDVLAVSFGVRAIKLNNITSANINYTDDFIIDITFPVISAFAISNINSNNFKIDSTDAILTYTATDNIELTNVYYSNNNGEWVTVTSGTNINSALVFGENNFKLKAVDKAGNIKYSDIIKFYHTTGAVPEDEVTGAMISTSTTGRTVTINITGNTVPTYLKEYQFYKKIGDGTATLIGTSKTPNFIYTHTTDVTGLKFGVRTVKLNDASTVLSSYSTAIVLDITPPVISAFAISDISNGYINKASKDAGNILLTYTVSDATSGIYKTYYSINNATWTEVTSGTNVTSLMSEGAKSIRLKTVDNCGNYTIADAINFIVDTVAPTIVTGMNGVIRLNNEINFNASSASDIEGYEIKYGGTNYGDATLLTKIVNNQTSGIITHKWLATSGTTLRVRVKAIDKAGNYSDESYVDIATTIPAAPTGLNGTGTFNGVNFWWNNVTTDNNSIYTDDITGYQYDAYIDSVTVDNKIASAIFTKTNNATVMIPDAKKDGKTHNIIIVLNTINKWSSASSSINLSKAIIRIEAVDMGSNPMQYDIISMEGGNTPLKNTPNLLKLIDGTDDTFVTDPTKCKLLLDDLVDLTSGQVPIGYATATKTSDGRFTSGTDLSVTVRGSHYGDKFGKSIAVEESRTNLFLYNNELTNGAWGKDQCDVTYDSMLDNNGAKLFKVTCNTAAQIMLRQYIPVTQGVTYTVSAFIRNIDISNASNLTIGASGFWSNTIPISSKVVKVSFTFTATATESKHFGILSQGYLSIGQSFLCSLPQVEVGSFATSAIKTEDTAVTRPEGICQYSKPELLNTSNFTISVWVKHNFAYNLQTPFAHGLFSFGFSTIKHVIYYDARWGTYGSYENGIGGELVGYNIPSPDNFNDWKHFVMVQNGTNGKVYMNDILIAECNDATPINSAIFVFGKYGNNFPANSELANCQIYNYTLTKAEIDQIFNAGLDGDKVILK